VSTVVNRPDPNALQRAWLLEIGIDARMLAHFVSEPFAPGPAEPASASVEEAPPAVQQGGPEAIAALLKRAPGLRSAETGASASPTLPVRPAARPAELPSNVGPGRSDVPVPSAAPVLLAPQEGETSLQALQRHAEQCTACGLHDLRGRLVFGEGAEQSVDWLFVGEAPGEYDDSTGLPFQGRAGELLRNMLASIGIRDQERAYFTNVLKCRPIGNRSPDPAEVAACMPILREQVRLLKPRVMVALGRVSAGALLGTEEELDALRGTVHAFVDAEGKKTPLVVMHHPASLLLHSQLKSQAWRDLNLLLTLKP
jgi:uracil-DNA glycosylase family 4